MSYSLTAAAGTRTPRDLDQDHHDPRREPSKLWALLEALAYAGAYIDPSGILAVQRLRQAQEEEEARHGRR